MISANCVARRDRGKGLPVLSARQLIGAATTALSLITGAFLLALAAGNARAQGSAPACDAAGEIALARFRDLAGVGRRDAQLLLERMDVDGITRRVGDRRVLRRAARAGA